MFNYIKMINWMIWIFYQLQITEFRKFHFLNKKIGIGFNWSIPIHICVINDILTIFIFIV